MAEAHGNPQLAGNLRRAAELTALGDDEVLAIYDALRPGRSTAAAADRAGRLAGRARAAPVRRAADRGGGGLRPPRPHRMTLVAGVDIGNATTEVVVLDGGRLLGADRLPTRGRKGSPESLHGAAALVRRIERRLGTRVDEVSMAPLRAADTATVTVPARPPATGRLRVLAAGVATPGGAGSCVGVPFWLDRGRAAGRPGAEAGAAPGRGWPGSRWSRAGWATRRRRAGSGSCGRPAARWERCWPRETRGCWSPTGLVPRCRSWTRSTWPPWRAARGWPWRCARPASR